MYLFPFRTGQDDKGNVFTSDELEKDMNQILEHFGFVPRFIDPANKTEHGFSKVYVQYEKEEPFASAMKVITPRGNKLEWTDNIYKNFRCTGYIGVFSLLTPDKLNEESKKIPVAINELRKKYHGNLQDVDFDTDVITPSYKPLTPSRNFFGYRVGKDRKTGHVSRTSSLDNSTKLTLLDFDLHQCYVDPANKTSDGFTKVFSQYELVGGDVNAFRVLTLDGNKLGFRDRNDNRFDVACYIGLISKPGSESNLNGRFKELAQRLWNMTKVYHRGLEDLVKKDKKVFN